MYLIFDHLIFLGIVDSGGYLVVAYFKRWILTLGHFPNVFSTQKAVEVRPVYIIPYFGHGQCFV